MNPFGALAPKTRSMILCARNQPSQSFAPLPSCSKAVDLDRQTSEERHQEIHPQTKCRHQCPAYKRTSQKQVQQNDNDRRPSFGANG